MQPTAKLTSTSCMPYCSAVRMWTEKRIVATKRRCVRGACLVGIAALEGTTRPASCLPSRSFFFSDAASSVQECVRRVESAEVRWWCKRTHNALWYQKFMAYQQIQLTISVEGKAISNFTDSHPIFFNLWKYYCRHEKNDRGHRVFGVCGEYPWF